MCENYIWVAGYHNEDLTVEVDLTKLGTQEIIRFSESKLLIKKGAEIEIVRGGYRYIFSIDLKNSKDLVEKDGYYTLPGGRKFELSAYPQKINLSNDPDSKIASKDNAKAQLKKNKTKIQSRIILPCNLSGWGGGGLNLAMALRALSNEKTSKIRYWDVKFGKSVENLTDELEKYCKSGGGTKYDQDWKSKILDLISKYGPEECIEIYLKKQNIDFNFFNFTPPGDVPKRTNLVLSKVTDGINTIGDKIILKSPVPESKIAENEKMGDLVDHIFNSLENVDSIVVNTVKHYDIFLAIINAFLRKINTLPSAEGDKIKFFVTFTNDNISFMKKLKMEDNDIFTTVFRHIYGLFNEEEFAKYMMDVENSTSTECDFLFNDGSPNFNKLIRLCATYRDHFTANKARRLYITLGKHGSIGVDENNHMMFVRTYPTRGVIIYNTSGGGDAWAGTIVLLEHHRKSDTPKQVMSRFMRIASGTAWAKMTNPFGVIRAHEVISLLDNNYIAFTPIGSVQAGPGYGPNSDIVDARGVCKRIEKASSINSEEYSNVITLY